jgi:hypothetical protein
MLGFVVMADWLSWSVLASLFSSSSLVLHTIRISERREGIEQAAAREAMGDEEMAGVLLNPALAVSILLLGYGWGPHMCFAATHVRARAHGFGLRRVRASYVRRSALSDRFGCAMGYQHTYLPVWESPVAVSSGAATCCNR